MSKAQGELPHTWDETRSTYLTITRYECKKQMWMETLQGYQEKQPQQGKTRTSSPQYRWVKQYAHTHPSSLQSVESWEAAFLLPACLKIIEKIGLCPAGWGCSGGNREKGQVCVCMCVSLRQRHSRVSAEKRWILFFMLWIKGWRVERESRQGAVTRLSLL